MREVVGLNTSYGTSWLGIQTKTIDQATAEIAYQQGILKNNYPVPAHGYITMITPHTVEIIEGVKKSYKGEYLAFDCECVFFAHNYPEHKE